MFPSAVVDIEDEKENPSGMVYILKTKRVAQIVKENRLREEAGAGADCEVEILQEEERERERFPNKFKSTFHSGDLEREMASVDTSTVVTVLHNIPLTLEMTERRLGSRSLHTQCPHCSFFILTKTEPELGLFAWLSSCLLCSLGCCPCALLPCYLHPFHDVTHYCPQCYQYLGTYTRLCC